MPIYNGVYYYMNDLSNVKEVLSYENRWWAKYEFFENTGLPISIQKEQFPEGEGCPFALTRDEFLSKLNDTTENLVVYTQDTTVTNKILSGTKSVYGTTNWTKVTLSNGVELYKQKINNNWGIVVISDPECKMHARIPVVVVIVALIVAVAITVGVCLVVNNYITQQYTTERQHEVLEAMRYHNRTVITDANGNPVGELWQFGNGSVYTYDYKTGQWTQQQQGASWSDLMASIGTGNVETQRFFNFLTTAVVAGVALIAFIAILYLILRSRKSKVEVAKA